MFRENKIDLTQKNLTVPDGYGHDIDVQKMMSRLNELSEEFLSSYVVTKTSKED